MNLKPAWATYDPVSKTEKKRKKEVRGEREKEKVGEEGSGKGDEVKRKGRKERGRGRKGDQEEREERREMRVEGDAEGWGDSSMAGHCVPRSSSSVYPRTKKQTKKHDPENRG